MRKKLLSKISAVFIAAACIISTCTATANAAVMDEGFEAVSLGADSAFDNNGESENLLPSSYSSADHGYVTDVKYQLFNDCWAYAGLGVLESKLIKSGFNVGNMSVDHLNAWASTRSNGKGWQRKYSGEGYIPISLGYLTSWQGGVEENDFSGINFSRIYYGDDVPSNLAKYGTTAVKYLTESSRDEIKQEIYDNGGVFASYATTNSCFDNNLTAYFMPSSYDGAYQGHSIEIVGWDDNFSKNRFNNSVSGAPKNDGAWLAKNSWGNYNSLGGYFWISYEDKYIFGSKFDPCFSITEVEKIDENTRLLQDEIYGATYSFDYINSDNITYINRFGFSDGYNTLDKVVFESRSIGADYKIYYIPIENNAPTSNETKWTLLDSGKLDYSGYFCKDIADFDITDTDGAIGIEIDTANADVKNQLGVGEWLMKSDGTLTFINESEKGQSYVCNRHKITDLMDWYKRNNNDSIGGTFIIKAIMKKSAGEQLLGDVNLDGKISILDATEIQKYIANLALLDDTQFKNADFNINGKVDITDATSIQKFLTD